MFEQTEMYNRRDCLAILNEKGGYFLCQCVDNIPFNGRKKYKINWLDEVKPGSGHYKLSYEDKINCNSIIGLVVLIKRKYLFILSKPEKEKILAMLKICLKTNNESVVTIESSSNKINEENVCSNFSTVENHSTYRNLNLNTTNNSCLVDNSTRQTHKVNSNSNHYCGIKNILIKPLEFVNNDYTKTNENTFSQDCTSKNSTKTLTNVSNDYTMTSETACFLVENYICDEEPYLELDCSSDLYNELMETEIQEQKINETSNSIKNICASENMKFFIEDNTSEISTKTPEFVNSDYTKTNENTCSQDQNFICNEKPYVEPDCSPVQYYELVETEVHKRKTNKTRCDIEYSGASENMEIFIEDCTSEISTKTPEFVNSDYTKTNENTCSQDQNFICNEKPYVEPDCSPVQYYELVETEVHKQKTNKTRCDIEYSGASENMEIFIEDCTSEISTKTPEFVNSDYTKTNENTCSQDQNFICNEKPYLEPDCSPVQYYELVETEVHKRKTNKTRCDIEYSGASENMEIFIEDCTSEISTKTPEFVNNDGTKTNEIACSQDQSFICNDEPYVELDYSPDKDMCENKTKSFKHSDKQQSFSEDSSCDECVSVPVAFNKNKKKSYDQSHCCYFCDKMVNKMSRHLTLVHNNEMEVAKILALPSKSRERREAFAQITRVGDYYRNCEILGAKKGKLLLMRRPTFKEADHVQYSDYGPCPRCLGFLLKHHLWHHIKYNCPKRNKTEPESNNKYVQGESLALISHTISEEITPNFARDILNTLKDNKNNPVKHFIMKDKLILRLGILSYEKYSSTKSDLTRQTMRRMGRLLKTVNLLQPSITTLRECLFPQNFDTIISAVKQLCEAEIRVSARPTMRVPSLGLKIGYGLRKCASIERGNCLRNGDLVGDKIMQSFLNLMDIEWGQRISSTAIATLNERKLNSCNLLPLTSDLIKLKNYLEKEIKYLSIKLTKDPRDKTSWMKLSELTLCRLVVFNKRRSGETARMTVVNYSERPDWQQENTQEIQMSLSPIEQKLSSTLALVYVTGKRDRRVPILLTKQMKDAIDLLVKTRENISEIMTENPFMFPKFNSLTYNRGHDCLRKHCNLAELEKPHLVTGTKLRKYVATVCQVFDLSENEYDWLARHLGHDVRVHREYYRLQESAVELTKVSRLLMAVDEGKANQFAGQTLSNINIADLPPVSESEEEFDSEEESMHTPFNDSMEQPFTKDDEFPEKAEGVCETQVINKKDKKCKSNSYKKNLQSVNKKKQIWGSKEKDAIFKYFRKFIKRQEIPGKEDCENFLSQNELTILKEKSWREIKWCVYNQIQKVKKMVQD